jgi:hypothetical protein
MPTLIDVPPLAYGSTQHLLNESFIALVPARQEDELSPYPIALTWVHLRPAALLTVSWAEGLTGLSDLY